MKQIRLLSLLLSFALLLSLTACQSGGGSSGSSSAPGSASGSSSMSSSTSSSGSGSDSASGSGSAADSSSSGSGSAGSSPDSSGESSSQMEQDPAPVEVPFQLGISTAYSMHPALSTNRANLNLAYLIYEPLFELDGGFQAVPVLCSSYTISEDLLTWTFVLQSGITFSDGTPLTAAIVADALNAAKGAGSRYIERLSGTTSIAADADGNLVITLAKPNGNLPALLDIPIALGVGDRPVGTGPYVLSESDAGCSLVARADWWQAGSKTLPTQELHLTVVDDSDGLVTAFDSGDVSLVDVDLMATSSSGYSGSYETFDYPTTDFLFLGLNARSGICRGSLVRVAISKAVDQNAIAQGDYARHAVASVLPVHPYSGVYDVTLAETLSYSSDTLAAAMEEAKLDGRSVRFLVNSENTAKVSAAQRITSQLESCGIQVNLERLPFEQFTNAVRNGNFDIYLGEIVLTADFTLSHLFGSGGSLNYGGYSNRDIDAALSAYESAQGDERKSAASALFTQLTTEVPIVPIGFKNGSILTQWGRLSGTSPVRENPFHGLEHWTIR